MWELQRKETPKPRSLWLRWNLENDKLWSGVRRERKRKDNVQVSRKNFSYPTSFSLGNPIQDSFHQNQFLSETSEALMERRGDFLGQFAGLPLVLLSLVRILGGSPLCFGWLSPSGSLVGTKAPILLPIEAFMHRRVAPPLWDSISLPALPAGNFCTEESQLLLCLMAVHLVAEELKMMSLRSCS